MTRNPVGHKRTKHIDIRHHFVRESVQSGLIRISYCASKDMLADVFTKAVPKPRFEALRDKLGLVNYQL